MSWVIVRGPAPAQSPPMTWEEDTLVERLLRFFRSHAAESAQADDDAQRRRSNRMRYFLDVFGATHWAERTGGRRN
jgi:hypothetical protein